MADLDVIGLADERCPCTPTGSWPGFSSASGLDPVAVELPSTAKPVAGGVLLVGKGAGRPAVALAAVDCEADSGSCSRTHHSSHAYTYKARLDL